MFFSFFFLPRFSLHIDFFYDLALFFFQVKCKMFSTISKCKTYEVLIQEKAINFRVEFRLFFFRWSFSLFLLVHIFCSLVHYLFHRFQNLVFFSFSPGVSVSVCVCVYVSVFSCHSTVDPLLLQMVLENGIVDITNVQPFPFQNVKFSIKYSSDKLFFSPGLLFLSSFSHMNFSVVFFS